MANNFLTKHTQNLFPFFTLLLVTHLLLLTVQQSLAETVEYSLTIAKQTVNFAAEPVEAMTINGGIPGPELRFIEGDTARIHVHNNMDVNTSIHWHGILLPPGMDGVPYISFPPIAPGTTFTYEFPIRQSGTYWYHSHTSLQEQRGLYGSIVIDPRESNQEANQDHVIVLSDWANEKPSNINRTLKRGSEWYALAKGSSQSILGAGRLNMLGAYVQREFMRMPPMDISDVAYDRFLANGKAVSNIMAEPGRPIRLRVINGSATTFFYLEFSGGPMTIISADGIDVEPVKQNRFLIGVAETYDVLVTLPISGSYEFRASAHDGSGYSSVWLGHGRQLFAPDVPKPNLYHSMDHFSMRQAFSLTPAGSMGMPDEAVNKGMFDKPGMMGMDHEIEGHGMQSGGHDPVQMDHTSSMNHSQKMDMSNSKPQQTDQADHSDMSTTSHNHMMAENKPKTAISMPSGHTITEHKPVNRSGKQHANKFGFLATDISSAENLAVDGISQERPWPPYNLLKSPAKTSFAADKKIREIRLTLDGDMERYVWFFNNKPLSESDSILIREGEVTRFIMINRTMMHHPMHLHGHFFRVLNGQGGFAPLKHTVNVAPMSTTVIEFDANEVGDWFFHCHLLYHMKGGMARLVHYENYTISPEMTAIRPKLYKDSWYFWGEADIISNMTEGILTLSNTKNIVTASWEFGWQQVDHTEWESTVSWDRYFNRFFTLFAGINLQGEESSTEDARGVFGFHYLLPLNFESRTWIDTDGGTRVSLEKSLELTPRISFFGEARYDTHELWEGQVGLSYLLHKNFSINVRWHSDYLWGGGLQVRF